MGYIYDPHFREFSKQLREIINSYPTLGKEELLAYQKEQIDTLVELEKRYREILTSRPLGVTVYKAFIDFIKTEKSTILSARPYFRERSETFAGVSYAIQNDLPESLFPFHFNYNFIHIIKQKIKLPKNLGLQKIDRQIVKLRNDLAIMNMPLAINRAKLFFDKTPKDQLTYLDFVQIAAAGLMSAIDKFVPPFSAVFRAVIIGRATGEFIDSYNQTLLHFYPNDRRRLYHANKVVRKYKGAEIDYAGMANEINAKGILNEEVTGDELSLLMQAASHISSDTFTHEDPQEQIKVQKMMSNKFVSEPDVQPDVMVEKENLRNKMFEAMQCLTVFEQKLLKLKGI